ncbi:MAG: GTPase Era [Acidobacteria bacterium]|nr:MAG: GTPase Era [Acidobacteriota bacterium]
MAFHSGFVCILGRPNAGKSTLLNALAGQKLAIVSPKPQTTRNRVLGVVHIPKAKNKTGAQIVLIDTPGLHRPDNSLGKKMMAEVREAMDGCELALVIVDAARPKDEDEDFVLQLVKKTQTPAMLLLNKIDLLRGEKLKLLPLIERYGKLKLFREIIPISARKSEGLTLLIEKLARAMPNGPKYFADDQITDQPLRFMAAELIREQLLLQTAEEVPHQTTVVLEQFEERKKLVRIAAVIYCEREGQKRILIGRQGQMLKQIGTEARLEIERMLGVKVFLELFVKVRPNWRQSRGFVEELDWRRQLEHLV